MAIIGVENGAPRIDNAFINFISLTMDISNIPFAIAKFFILEGLIGT